MKRSLYPFIIFIFSFLSVFSQIPDANGVLYVKKGSTGTGNSWSNAIGELSTALYYANFTRGQIKEIWVAGGTYAPAYSPDWISTDVHDYSFRLLSNLNIYGGFAGTETAVSARDLTNASNASILTGDVGGGNYAYHVVVGVNDIGTPIVDGFTITRGDANGFNMLTVDNIVLMQYNGAGIYLSNNCAPVLSNLVITTNRAVLWGGGLYSERNLSSKQYQLSNSVITGNDGSFGGGVCNSQSSPNITNVKIWSNTGAFGGALYAENCNTQLENVSIKGNTGASYGSAIYGPSSGITLKGCEITGNYLYGSTTCIMADRILLVNTTIAGNNGSGAVFGIVFAAEIYNSVIYGNEAGVSDNISFSTQVRPPGTILVFNSLIQGEVANATNHVLAGTTDPQFTNPVAWSSALTTSGDYSLKPGSPLIDAGNNGYYPGLSATTTDINGDPRVVDYSNGGIIDIGARENRVGVPQTIIATDIVKTYGDADFDPGATASSGLAVSYTSSDNSIAEVIAGKIRIKKAGTVTITVSQAGNSSFNPATNVTFTLTINKAALTVTAATISTVYTGVGYSGGSLSVAGLVYGETVSVLSGVPVYSGSSQSAIDPGTYDIIPSGLTADNYTIQYVNGQLSINKAVLTITVANAARCYNTADPGFAISYTGFVNNETPAVLHTPATVTTSVTATSAAGDYALVPVGATADNYTFNYVNGTFTIYPLPVTSIATPGDVSLCGNNKTITLTATGTYSYAWSNGQSGNTIIVSVPGTYSLTATDAHGCTAPAANTVNITMGQLPVPAFSYDSYCANAPVTFTNKTTGDVSYVWTTSDGQSSTATSPSITFAKAGTYIVTLTATADACPDNPVSTSREIAVEGAIANARLNDVNIAAGVPVQLNVRKFSDASYQWSPAIGLSGTAIYNPIATLTANKRYYITMSFASGCNTTDTLAVYVTNGKLFAVANAFTPNNDGLNDVLHVGLQGVASLEFFEIYDRWGKMVFRTTSGGDGWDGTRRSQPCGVGTYIWAAQGRDYTGQLVKQSGTVILIR